MLEGYRLVYNLTLQFINKRNFYNAKDNIKVDIKAINESTTKMAVTLATLKERNIRARKTDGTSV